MEMIIGNIIGCIGMYAVTRASTLCLISLLVSLTISVGYSYLKKALDK